MPLSFIESELVARCLTRRAAERAGRCSPLFGVYVAPADA
jgi:hypothetical protein